MDYNSKLYKTIDYIQGIFSAINWMPLYALFNKGKGYNLTEEDHSLLKEKLANSYYIILTYRKTHLTTYLLGILALIKTGKWPTYGHALMNVDSITSAGDWEKYKFEEAEHAGVVFSKFLDVFNCDRVCLLKPKSLNNDQWNNVIDGMLTQFGEPYDDLFDLSESQHVSCVELVLDALKKDSNYQIDFANLQSQIDKIGNLTPQMYRDCPDFEIVLEIKR